MPNRVKEVEREQRNEIKSMRTSESQELGSTVAQEMEKKRKLAELKRLQVLSISAAARIFSQPSHASPLRSLLHMLLLASLRVL